MSHRAPTTWRILIAAGLLAMAAVAESQAVSTAVADLSGTYSGRRCVASSDVCPEMNLAGAQRLLTARAQAFAAAFDELAAPKYDCWPATLPTLFGDPYIWQLEQQADRVTFRYEKDDVIRIVWLEGHGHPMPAAGDFFIHGHSTGRYEGEQLVVETAHFVFDPGGLAGDLLSAPSSTQKRLTERYWRDGDNLRMSLVVEDPVFLLQPIEYVMAWAPSDEPLPSDWDCDPAAAQRNLNVVQSKYPQDPPVNRRN